MFDHSRPYRQTINLLNKGFAEKFTAFKEDDS